MKNKDFADLKSALTEALEHARGKITLKTRDMPCRRRRETQWYDSPIQTERRICNE